MSLFGLFESRASLENPAVPLTDAGMLSWLMGPTSDAGVPVNEHTAMAMSAVYRAVSLLSGLSGALPLNVVEKDSRKAATSALLDEPHPELTRLEFWRLSMVHRTLWGNSYSQKVYKRGGTIDYLAPISPNRVTPLRVTPSASNRGGKLYRVVDDEGSSQVLSSKDILHIPGLGYDGTCGYSPIKIAAQSIGMALAAEKYGAKLFGSGNLLSGFLTTEAKLTKDQAETLKARWQEKTSGIDKAHEVAILDAGAKFESLTMPNDDAQLLESRDFQITELSRFYGVPPYLMFQTQKTTSWGTSLEQQATGFVKFDLHPMWLAPTEQRVTKELLEDGLEARYDLDSLMRGDSIARAEFYRVMYEMGTYSANDIRAKEDMPPRPGGDDYMEPMNPNTTTSPMGSDKVLGGSSLGPSDSG